MAGGMNLASKYSKKVDERFHRESQAMLALNNDYEFTGAETVKVYSIPIVPMNDYSRSGSGRYGTPDDLSRNVQTLTVTRDRAFTFIIDRGDRLQSEMVTDAGKALSRQLREVVTPEFDTYVFKTLANAAVLNGNSSTTAIDKTNAYACFLAGMERLGDFNVPDKGRVAFCSYRFANYLKQDSAFMKYGNQSQEMILKGVIGEVDGCRIVKVPSNRLPAGAAFIITHSVCATAPKQLSEYKIHDNPPGISGWLVEGRFIYDCFVLNEKAKGIYYHGGQSVLKVLNVSTAARKSGKYDIVINGAKEGAKRYYAPAETIAELPSVTQGSAITTSDWTEATSDLVANLTAGDNKYVRVVEVDAASKPLALGDTVINAG